MEGTPKISGEASEVIPVSERQSEKVEGTVRSIFVKAVFEGINTPTHSIQDSDKVFTIEHDRTSRFLSLIKDLPEDGSYVQANVDAINVETRGRFYEGVGTQISISEQVVQATIGEKKIVGSVIELEPHDTTKPALELNSVLPPSCSFVPADFDRGIADIKSDIHDGGNHGTFSFRRNPEGDSVIYGALTTDEDLFSLLHEVAHAWQNRAKPTAIENYKYANNIVVMTVNCASLHYFSKKEQLIEDDIAHIKAIAESFNRQDEDPVDFMHAFLKRNTPFVEKMGVSFDGLSVNINNPDLQEKIEDYVWAERHAWSVAYKAYDVLYKAGYTFSSEKQDFRDKVRIALESYQAGLSFIEMKLKKDFIQPKPEKHA